MTASVSCKVFTIRSRAGARISGQSLCWERAEPPVPWSSPSLNMGHERSGLPIARPSAPDGWLRRLVVPSGGYPVGTPE